MRTTPHRTTARVLPVGTIDEARWWVPDALEASGETHHDPLLDTMRTAVERVVP